MIPYVATGVFKKALNAFECLKRADVCIGGNTTLMKENIRQLDELYSLFLEYGVSSWQIQPGIPEGRLSEHRDYVLSTEEIMQAIDFSLQKNQQQKNTADLFTLSAVWPSKR